METFKINYKSDFVLRLASDAGWNTAFTLEFWSNGAPTKRYYATHDGNGNYTNCKPDSDTELRVMFDDHGLGIGNLMLRITYSLADEEFRTGKDDEVVNVAAITVLNDEGEEVNVVLNLEGETAAEVQYSLPLLEAERKRQNAEAQRNINETQRIAAEQQRQLAETLRNQAELDRQASEDVRKSNESTREAAEQQRQTAEAARAAEFKTNEAARKETFETNEAERQATFEANEAERQVLYEKVAKNTDGIELLNTNTGISEYPEFSEVTAYAVGNVVIFEGKMYRFTSAHAAGVWDGSQVEDWSERKKVDGKIGALEWKTSEVNKEVVETEEENIVIKDNDGNVLAEITPDSSTFKNLKSNDKDVLTEHQSLDDYAKKTDIPDISGKQDKIEAVEQELVPADVDRIELQTDSGKTAVTIEAEETADNKEEQVWCDSEYETDEYVKIGSYGIKAKKFLNMGGDDAIPTIDTSMSEPSDKKVPSSKAVADYVANHAAFVFPDHFLPNKIYGVVGMPQRLYVRGIVYNHNPYLMYNNFGGSSLGDFVNGTKTYKRYAELIPTNEGSGILTHSFINDAYVESPKIQSQYIAKNAPTSNDTPINVLCVGASTTAGGEWAKELRRMLTANGSRPSANVSPSEIGLGLDNINFVGRLLIGDINIEAAGGWTWARFIRPTNMSWRIQVTGQTGIVRGDSYTISGTDGNIVKVQLVEENITAGTGNCLITLADGYSKFLPTSGTLTKHSGSGASTIEYTDAVEEKSAPFYNAETSQIDFIQYANQYCNGQIDVCIVDLTPYNYGCVGNDSLENVIADANEFLDALHRNFPNCKVILHHFFGCNTEYGTEYNGTFTYKSNSLSTRRMSYRYGLELQKIVDERDYCYFANVAAEIDQEDSFPMNTRLKNLRTTETEVYGSNGLHPTNKGYMMAADAMFRCFVNVVF